MSSIAARTQIATRRWTADDCARIEPSIVARAPALSQTDIGRVADDLDVWDAWPLADAAGWPVPWRGGELWFALAAPATPDPEQRHFAARIHHFHRIGDRFHLLGPTFADHWTPGSREWSGSARLVGDRVELYFTGAGVKGDGAPNYRQRLFRARTRLAEDDDAVFVPWHDLQELLQPGGPYMAPDEIDGRIGEIKAFRDPCPWRSADGHDYLLFTGSSAAEPGPFNGVIGIAEAVGDAQWLALPPLIDAAGVNNELERPHIVEHGGRLYLFWSTQANVFAPGIAAPTGLYGATAPEIGAPWELLNGHGLVFANPKREPFQCYSWWVLPDLTVASFVDYWGLDDAEAPGKPAGRQHFGGTFAPFDRITLDGSKADLVGASR